MIDPSFVLALSLLSVDHGGHHPLKPIAVDAASAIADECNLHPMQDIVIPGDELCAAIYLEHSFRESNWKLDAIGDNHTSFGPFQLKTITRPPSSWKDAVAQFAPLLKRASVCPEPLEMLAVGHCGEKIGQDISRSRTLAARRMVWEIRLP